MYEYLKYVVKKNGMTLKDFAAQIGVSDRTLTSKLNGTSDWLYGEYIQICKLFPGEDPKKLMERA